MKKIFSFFCRHSTIKLIRAHQESPIGKQWGHMSAWTDRMKCLNLFRCARCGKYLKGIAPWEGVYDSASYAIKEYAPGGES
jgi:hypothetical protein